MMDGGVVVKRNGNGNITAKKTKKIGPAKDSLTEVQKKRFERRLLKYEELPAYLKDNEFIVDYYRSEWPLKEAFLSVFSWHNETLNVWTHLGGFLIFLALTVLSWMDTSSSFVGGLFFGVSRSNQVSLLMKNISSTSSLPDLQAWHERHDEGVSSKEKIPQWPWFIFLLGAMGCLVCSSLSHLLACHSRRLYFFFWRLDYAGISLMIVSSFVPPIYYTFYCHPNARFFYLTTITTLGIVAVITLLSPALSTPRFRPFRASLFLTMGFSGIIPAAHAIILHWVQPHILLALAYELAMAIFYASGAGVYVSRIPERWKPGAFDIAGHSHQIFHVFVVAGALAHYVATQVVMDWRLQNPICESSRPGTYLF